ncbi:uncharacterized protein LOC110026638 isoform X2 [Phalaenopsis equestris]|uniref:uncharacterized protein LOC110026638 isoform X2 n=1 Tax=Phalaenopsis equestris TaxID=78828 RepID=UPI0009E34D08|nr:uncharacterized protein LOC110026638 isoform X2 [Phalaenopsis equestris]XP_020583310.1 uncharacterized protein LOC110026638 isoform X2 [Phalaenopsis equestris]
MKMTDYGFVPKKDALVANPSRRSPLVLKMVVLVAAMTGSVCICSVFLKQMEEPSQPRIKRANLTEKALVHVVGVNLTNKNLPNFLKLNLTEKNPPDLSVEEKNLPGLTRVNLKEQNLSFVVSPNLEEVNFPHLVRVNTSVLTLPPALKVNETPFLDPKQSESLLHDFNYNNTKTYTRVESGCMHASLYAIVSLQRSGSKWFEALLNSHDNIWSHGEIFYNVDRKCNMTVIKKVLDKVCSSNWNTTSSFRRKKKSCMAAVGFKWMLNQVIFVLM